MWRLHPVAAHPAPPGPPPETIAATDVRLHGNDATIGRDAATQPPPAGKLAGLIPSGRRAVSRSHAVLSGTPGGGLQVRALSERPVCIVRGGKLQPVWLAHGSAPLAPDDVLVVDGISLLRTLRPTPAVVTAQEPAAWALAVDPALLLAEGLCAFRLQAPPGAEPPADAELVAAAPAASRQRPGAAGGKCVLPSGAPAAETDGSAGQPLLKEEAGAALVAPPPRQKRKAADGPGGGGGGDISAGSTQAEVADWLSGFLPAEVAERVRCVRSIRATTMLNSLALSRRVGSALCDLATSGASLANGRLLRASHGRDSQGDAGGAVA